MHDRIFLVQPRDNPSRYSERLSRWDVNKLDRDPPLNNPVQGREEKKASDTTTDSRVPLFTGWDFGRGCLPPPGHNV